MRRVCEIGGVEESLVRREKNRKDPSLSSEIGRAHGGDLPHSTKRGSVPIQKELRGTRRSLWKIDEPSTEAPDWT